MNQLAQYIIMLTYYCIFLQGNAAYAELKQRLLKIVERGWLMTAFLVSKILQLLYEAVMSLEEILLTLDSSSSRKRVNSCFGCTKFEDALETHVLDQINDEGDHPSMLFSIDLGDLASC